MKILDRYILRAHIAPFLFSVTTILFVFTLHFITHFLSRFVGKGLSFWVIMELIAFEMAWMVVLAVPMAVLIATLVAFGTFTNNSEMTVMRSSGLSLYRLILPVLLAGILLSIVLERFNNTVLPEANFHAKSLMKDIVRTKPTIGFTEKAFSGLVDGYSILVRKEGKDSNTLEDITIYENTGDEHKTVITAEKGHIAFTADYHYLILTLYNGEMHELPPENHEEYRKMTFDKHRYVFSSTGYGFERTDEDEVRRNDRELSARQLFAIGETFQQRILDARSTLEKNIAREQETVNNLRATPGSGNLKHARFTEEMQTRAREQAEKMLARIDREIDHIERSQKMYNKYMAEFHKKYALSFSCIAFIIVGAPLGVLAKRGGFGIGAGLSLVLFLLYWSLLITGEKLSDRGLLDPGISMWLANIAMVLVGLFTMFRVSGTVSGSGR